MRKTLLLLISSLVLLAGCEDRVVRHSSSWYKKNKKELIEQVELCRKQEEQEKKDTAQPKDPNENTSWLKEIRTKLDQLIGWGTGSRLNEKRIKANCENANLAFYEFRIMAGQAAVMVGEAATKVHANLLSGIPADEGYEPLNFAVVELVEPKAAPQLIIDKNSGVITAYLNQELQGGQILWTPTIVSAQTAGKKGKITWHCSFKGDAIDIPFIPEDCLPEK